MLKIIKFFLMSAITLIAPYAYFAAVVLFLYVMGKYLLHIN